jgi:hypothetical protein
MRALGIPLSVGDPSRGMERLWSLAGATGGNRSQMEDRRNGKEGVNGSSPLEGFGFLPA